jgi:hypothetical protein
MTAVQAYELIAKGGATDFARLIEACESFGPHCLIGDLAVNCYVEPVYTLDADIVVSAAGLCKLNAMTPRSDLRIQFTTDERYQAFLPRSVESDVLGVPVRIARRTSRAVSSGPTAIHGDASANARRTNWT